MQWHKLPRWLRDTLSVVGAMSVLLIVYNGFFDKHPNWALVPLQIVLALVAVGAWSYFSYRSQAKRKLAEQAKAAAAKQRAVEQEQQRIAAEKQAAATREKNLERNQAHQQRRR